MEDFQFMKKYDNNLWIGGIFDGHGGDEVANFLN
jgi:serine/threonine protein phosphatase PrpC